MNPEANAFIDLNQFKALTFDVYGTLIDWEPPILRFLQAWARRNRLVVDDRELLAAFDDARAHYQQLKPAKLYPEVLKSCYAYICDRWRTTVDNLEQSEFSNCVCEWEPFDDVPESLKYLKQFYKLGALSNIDEKSLTLTTRKLGTAFDIVVTAERVKAYKPRLLHFVAALGDLGKMGISPQEILHVGQSLRADIRPANLLGLTTAWINRGQRSLGLTGHGAELASPNAQFATLGELVAAHRQAAASARAGMEEASYDQQRGGVRKNFITKRI
jgi:putative hydrolase of the HAD superfamily